MIQATLLPAVDSREGTFPSTSSSGAVVGSGASPATVKVARNCHRRVSAADGGDSASGGGCSINLTASAILAADYPKDLGLAAFTNDPTGWADTESFLLPRPCRSCSCYRYNDRITLGGDLAEELGLRRKSLGILGARSGEGAVSDGSPDTAHRSFYLSGLHSAVHRGPHSGLRRQNACSALLSPTPVSSGPPAAQGPLLAGTESAISSSFPVNHSVQQSGNLAPTELLAAATTAPAHSDGAGGGSGNLSQLMRHHSSFNAADFLYRTEPIAPLRLRTRHRRCFQMAYNRRLRRYAQIMRARSPSGDNLVVETVSYRSSSSHMSSMMEDDENDEDASQEMESSIASSESESLLSANRDRRIGASCDDETENEASHEAAVTAVAAVGSWMYGLTPGRTRSWSSLLKTSPAVKVAAKGGNESPTATKKLISKRMHGGKQDTKMKRHEPADDALSKLTGCLRNDTGSCSGTDCREENERSVRAPTLPPITERPDSHAVKLAAAQSPLPGLTIFPNPSVKNVHAPDEYILAKIEVEQRRRLAATAAGAAVLSGTRITTFQGSEANEPSSDGICRCHCHLPTTRVQMETFLHQGFTSTVLACTRLAAIHGDVLQRCFGDAFHTLSVLGCPPLEEVEWGDWEEILVDPTMPTIASEAATTTLTAATPTRIRNNRHNVNENGGNQIVSPPGGQISNTDLEGFEGDIDTTVPRHGTAAISRRTKRHHSTSHTNQTAGGNNTNKRTGWRNDHLDSACSATEGQTDRRPKDDEDRSSSFSAKQPQNLSGTPSTNVHGGYDSKRTDDSHSVSTVVVGSGQLPDATVAPGSHITESGRRQRHSMSKSTLPLAQAAVIRQLYRWLQPIQGAQDLVIKLIHKDKCTADELEQCIFESRFLAELEHPNVARLLGHYDGDHELWLFFERANYDDLEYSMLSRTMDETQARYIMGQLLQGLEYVHSKDIIHGDIKPKNILVYDKRRRLSSPSVPRGNKESQHPKFTRNFAAVAELKLADFGLAQKLPPERDTIRFNGVRGSQGYFAPEILLRRDYGTKVDLWAAGIIHFQLLAGYEPFYPSSSCISEPVRFDDRAWDNVSDAAKDFCRKLLTFNPLERMSASEALNHPWMLGATTVIR